MSTSNRITDEDSAGMEHTLLSSSTCRPHASAPQLRGRSKTRGYQSWPPGRRHVGHESVCGCLIPPLSAPMLPPCSPSTKPPPPQSVTRSTSTANCPPSSSSAGTSRYRRQRSCAAVRADHRQLEAVAAQGAWATAAEGSVAPALWDSYNGGRSGRHRRCEHPGNGGAGYAQGDLEPRHRRR